MKTTDIASGRCACGRPSSSGSGWCGTCPPPINLPHAHVVDHAGRTICTWHGLELPCMCCPPEYRDGVFEGVQPRGAIAA